MAALYYELDALEALITESLHPKNLLRQKSLTESDFDQLTKLLLKEKEAIKKRLKKITYSYSKENHRKLYIRQHQFAVTQLNNRLVDFILPKEAGDLLETPHDSFEIKLYKRCLVEMKDLFSFIREEFPQYFNYDAKVPAAIILNLLERIRPEILKLKRKLLKSGHEARLVEIILQTISSYYSVEGNPPLTYRKLDFLKSLLKDLDELKHENFSVAPYPSLAMLLVYVNFNITAFKNYLINCIHEEINKCNSLTEKIERISFHHKEINQLPLKPCSTFLMESPSVQSEIATWLFNEMTHLEKKQALSLTMAEPYKEPDDLEKERGIYSILTVEELGLFFKIQKDTNLLKNKNMKQVAKNLATYWHTKQKENISWQYLYNSMSYADVGTIRNLEDKLVGMVNWLRKMKSGLS